MLGIGRQRARAKAEAQGVSFNPEPLQFHFGPHVQFNGQSIKKYDAENAE